MNRRPSADRAGLPGVPEFAPEDLGRADGAARAALPPDANAGPLPRAGETVRQRRDRLPRLAAALDRLHQPAVTVGEATQRVAELLGIALRVAVPVLGRVAGAVEPVARLKAVRPGWWDADRRREVQGR